MRSSNCWAAAGWGRCTEPGTSRRASRSPSSSSAWSIRRAWAVSEQRSRYSADSITLAWCSCAAGSHDGVPFLVLELVDGPSLADVLASGPLGVEQSISIGQQLAEALMHAHGLDIVHRDSQASQRDPATPSRRRPLGRLGDRTLQRHDLDDSRRRVSAPPRLAPEQLEGRRGRPRTCTPSGWSCWSV